eukprot:TRINITY_DN67248_c6_g9_i1.p3 TRINITY_DN67248_c6_g9~~TRINITY_DN67248_c6_g9_i1.p3  ORF type:complete len:115 (-),score=1.38 TRINITY_DN67248_c6_g9_i1:280-624(-)
MAQTFRYSEVPKPQESCFSLLRLMCQPEAFSAGSLSKPTMRKLDGPQPKGPCQLTRGHHWGEIELGGPARLGEDPFVCLQAGCLAAHRVTKQVFSSGQLALTKKKRIVEIFFTC